MPTPTSSATPYCTVDDLFVFVDWRQVADWAADPSGAEEPPPTRAELLDATSVTGKIVAKAILAASGKFESYCLRGGLYTAADLNALANGSLAYRQELAAGLTLWVLANRRAPGAADPEKIPGAKTALDALEALRKGERIFALADQVAAGAGMVATTFVDTQDPNRTVNRAARFFGPRGCRGG